MRRAGFGAFAAAMVAALMSFSTAGAPAAVPADPVTYSKGTPLELTSAESGYWTFVPNSYDASHATPTKLVVWLHGCGGYASGDIWTVSPGGAQDWISVAVGGREGGCWNMGADESKVLAAIANVETHFNINPRIVILGGYSSGGDLAYRTAFNRADKFAGLLVTNTSPFSDSGQSQATSLAATTWMFNVVHLAHLEDTTYPIETVRKETDAMVSAGFPLTRVEVEGTHYDNAGDIVNGNPVPGTSADITTYLLSHIDDGWMSPEPELTEPYPDPDPLPAVEPKVSITAKPGKSTKSRRAKFRFTSTVAGSSFQCRLDGGDYTGCHSPRTYRSLHRGSHRFRVRAIAAEVTGPVVIYRWTVKRTHHPDHR